MQLHNARKAGVDSVEKQFEGYTDHDGNPFVLTEKERNKIIGPPPTQK